MPDKLIPLFEAISLVFFNAIFLIFSTTILSLITFVFSTILLLTRFKRDIEKFHNGSITEWFKWWVKKNK